MRIEAKKTQINGSGSHAKRFIDYLLSAPAQAIMARSGFAPA